MTRVLCALVVLLSTLSARGQVNWYCPDFTMYSSKIDAEVHCRRQSTKRIPSALAKPQPRFYTIPEAPVMPPVMQSTATGQPASLQGPTTGVTGVQSSGSV